ncbi:MAG: AmmeMemoRadiSam system protein A [Desulfovibrio sp.]|jgi:AmmeMemoRadiSam system protein A|nr:AmmeMemoRadiSam system protein A [Desulfovibrio sp.]
MPITFSLTQEEQRYLLDIAKNAISQRLGIPGQTIPARPQSQTLGRNLGSFVTLTRNGNLRGCIGTIVGREPLEQNVVRMAVAAAFDDYRFHPLTAQEWGSCDVHISVLDELTRCPDPGLIEVGKHGLVLQLGGRSGVFLPQVPVEQGWDRLMYLEQLCNKAGLPPGSWKAPGAEIFWYEAFVFPA